MKREEKIYVAGHSGMIGSAILKKLREHGYSNIVTSPHRKLDLICGLKVRDFFRKERPMYVFLAAAKVGGISANITYPGQFIYENIAIQSNVIHYAFKYQAKKLLFFGSACSYPRDSKQPIKEECLFNGRLEPTNEPYAVAKIAGIAMCRAYNKQYGSNFIIVMPANVYGPGDRFDLSNSHVIPALLRKIHEAQIKKLSSVSIWGSGKPKRDFIFVDDVASASIFLMQNYNNTDIINIGSGKSVSIKELAYIIKKIVGYKGKLIFDVSQPDGMPNKLLDITKSGKVGWKPEITLEQGLSKTYEWFKLRWKNYEVYNDK